MSVSNADCHVQLSHVLTVPAYSASEAHEAATALFNPDAPRTSHVGIVILVCLTVVGVGWLLFSTAGIAGLRDGLVSTVDFLTQVDGITWGLLAMVFVPVFLVWRAMWLSRFGRRRHWQSPVFSWNDEEIRISTDGATWATPWTHVLRAAESKRTFALEVAWMESMLIMPKRDMSVVEIERLRTLLATRVVPLAEQLHPAAGHGFAVVERKADT